MVEELEHPEGMALRLRPNRSLSWRGNIIIFCIIAVIAFLVAVAWSLAGAWMILPFAGLEIAFLAYGLYYTSRQCYRQEVLVLAPETIRLEKGLQNKEMEWEMPRRWVRLVVTAPRHGFALPGLSLAFRDQELPLAPFLNQEDQEALLGYLQRSGIVIDYKSPDDLG